MPVIGAGLGHQAELTARRVPIFGAKLVGGEVEFRDRIRNDRRVVSRHAQIVVIHTVNREIVVAWTRSADGSANSRDPTRLGHNVGSQHCQVEGAAVERASAIGKLHLAHIISII